jgi:hypothetical protein
MIEELFSALTPNFFLVKGIPAASQQASTRPIS